MQGQASSSSNYSLPRLPWTVVLLPLAFLAGCQPQSDGERPSAVLELTDATFQRAVMESAQPVVVEFWAPWCQPCLDMQPAMEQLARGFHGRVTVAALNIDEYPDTAASFGVNLPPVVVVFRNGEIIKRRSGKQTTHSLAELICGLSENNHADHFGSALLEEKGRTPKQAEDTCSTGEY